MVQIYLEPLVLLPSQHGPRFHWTGTNSSVLRWFCHANVLRQLCFPRFRGGFCEFVCTKLSFLRKLSLIRTQLNRRGTREPPDQRQRQRCSLGGVQAGARRAIFLVPAAVPASPQKWFPALIGAKYYLCYADEAADV